jgi:hypothetical protein
VLAQTGSYAAPAIYIPNADTDSVIALVELRGLSTIEYDRDVATTKRAAAEMRETRARLLQSRAATKIKIKDTEIAAFKAQVDQAKTEKNDMKKLELEGERDHAELEKKLLQRREQLRQKDIGLAKAEIEYYAAEAKGYDNELELARLRSKRMSFEGGRPPREQYEEAWKLDKQIREMEGRTLDTKTEAAQKLKKLAEQAVKITKARQDVWEAQRKLFE